MNKQQIFALYLGNPKQEIKTPEGVYPLIEISRAKCFVNAVDDKPTEDRLSVWQNGMINDHTISDCQLILTPISEMTGEDEEDYLNQRVKCENCHLNGCESFESMFWLIQHGYALYDQWFTDRTAVKA